MINSGQRIGGFTYDDYIREQEWLKRDIEYVKKDKKCIEIKNESDKNIKIADIRFADRKCGNCKHQRLFHHGFRGSVYGNGCGKLFIRHVNDDWCCNFWEPSDGAKIPDSIESDFGCIGITQRKIG